MTTFNFVTSRTVPFTFQPTLDGEAYLVTLQWNLYGQRYYILGQTLAGRVVFNTPLIASPLDYDIDLVAPFGFTSTLVFRGPSRQFEVTP